MGVERRALAPEPQRRGYGCAADTRIVSSGWRHSRRPSAARLIATAVQVQPGGEHLGVALGDRDRQVEVSGWRRRR